MLATVDDHYPWSYEAGNVFKACHQRSAPTYTVCESCFQGSIAAWRECQQASPSNIARPRSSMKGGGVSLRHSVRVQSLFWSNVHGYVLECALRLCAGIHLFVAAQSQRRCMLSVSRQPLCGLSRFHICFFSYRGILQCLLVGNLAWAANTPYPCQRLSTLTDC
jgi:hypothetical protein